MGYFGKEKTDKSYVFKSWRIDEWWFRKFFHFLSITCPWKLLASKNSISPLTIVMNDVQSLTIKLLVVLYISGLVKAFLPSRSQQDRANMAFRAILLFSLILLIPESLGSECLEVLGEAIDTNFQHKTSEVRRESNTCELVHLQLHFMLFILHFPPKLRPSIWSNKSHKTNWTW